MEALAYVHKLFVLTVRVCPSNASLYKVCTGCTKPWLNCFLS